MKPHYERIRKVKTRSGATAIQIGFYQGKRFKLKKHIGSSSDVNKVNELISIASEYIQSHSPQLKFNFNPASEEILFKRGVFVEQSILEEAYKYLEGIYKQLGFNSIENDILKYFAIIRVLEPASKLRSIALLEKYFDIKYKKTTIFRELAKLSDLKEEVSRLAVEYARKNLNFDFSLVFYDVTTLYFETFNGDDFRLNGFSKDNKINQPQILVGLVVNNTGFPIYYDIFRGNTFEGKTIIPVILKLKQKYRIDKFTVVADAAMLSADNLSSLEIHNIDYVVGARIGSLKPDETKNISLELNKTDGKIIRIGNILYEYSQKRAKKDKADNDRQIEKAKYYLSHPSKVIKRSKFLSANNKRLFELNTALIEKHRLIEGIKGYRTNINNLGSELLIARYKDLWRVEQSFKMAKSDLEARPVYHRKQKSIKYHLLIVFVALAMAKVIEVETGRSIKKVTEELKDKWTITLRDKISGNTLKVKLDKKPH